MVDRRARTAPRIVTVNVGEKGIAWRRLRVDRHPRARLDAVRRRQCTHQGSRGRSAASPTTARQHTSTPSGRRRSTRWGCPTSIRDALTSAETIWDTHRRRCRPRSPVLCHAQTHTTFSPNVCHGGQKTNTIPDVIDIDLDIRTVPGTTRRRRRTASPRRARRSVRPRRDQRAAAVTIRRNRRRGPGNPLWDSVTQAHPDRLSGRQARSRARSSAAPTPASTATAAATAYGTGLFSPSMDFATFGARFHGNDERIDTESLGLSANYFYGIAKDLLG